MKQRIYGIVDVRTGNFGDICVMSKDEDFIAGFTQFASNIELPDYILRDMVGVCYGEIVSNDDDVPQIKPFVYPEFILYGRDLVGAVPDQSRSGEEKITNED